MSDLPGVSLVQSVRKPNFDKCIICGKGKSKKENLSNSAGSRCKIIEASTKLNDGLLSSLDEVDIQKIKFHPTSCYGGYILKSKRFKEKEPSPENPETDDEHNEHVQQLPLTR